MTVFALPAQPVFPDPIHADEDGLLAVVFLKLLSEAGMAFLRWL